MPDDFGERIARLEEKTRGLPELRKLMRRRERALSDVKWWVIGVAAVATAINSLVALLA